MSSSLAILRSMRACPRRPPQRRWCPSAAWSWVPSMIPASSRISPRRLRCGWATDRLYPSRRPRSRGAPGRGAGQGASARVAMASRGQPLAAGQVHDRHDLAVGHSLVGLHEHQRLRVLRPGLTEDLLQRILVDHLALHHHAAVGEDGDGEVVDLLHGVGLASLGEADLDPAVLPSRLGDGGGGHHEDDEEDEEDVGERGDVDVGEDPRAGSGAAVVVGIVHRHVRTPAPRRDRRGLPSRSPGTPR